MAHIRHDYDLSPETEDREIYDLATQENRIIITQDNDFKTLLKINGTGVFILSSHLSNRQIDEIIVKFITGKNPEDFKGKVVKVKID